jgi:large subunit ribosomal protein L6
MSRIGKKPIIIPSGVIVTINNKHLAIKGPKGELSIDIHPKATVVNEDNHLVVSVEDGEDKAQKSLWGTMRKLIANIIEGVTKGFEKKLEINGVGYKMAVSGNKLLINVGFSHAVNFELPAGISAELEKNVLTVKGIDKQKVGEMAAQIRRIKKPEPYKGKGIKYTAEKLLRKAGKAARS